MPSTSDADDDTSLYTTALETRLHYRDSFFTRYGQFLTVQGLLVGALTLARSEFASGGVIITGIGIAGILLTMLWLWATAVSMWSLEAWSTVLEELEGDLGTSGSSVTPIFSLYEQRKQAEMGTFDELPRFEYVLPGIVLLVWLGLALWSFAV